MALSPLAPHAATPAELRDRLAAERRGEPHLIYRDAQDRQRIVALGPMNSGATVGRDGASDVALEWDRGVSRIHARLERLGSVWTLVDDGLSRNGSFVNGERVHGRRRLADRDLLRFGETLVVFRAPVATVDETVPAQDAGAPVRVTEAQRRVLLALCRPFRDGGSHALPASNHDIARELHLSVDAVKTHMRALFDAVGVEDLPHNRKRARLVELAFARGVVAPRDLREE